MTLNKPRFQSMRVLALSLMAAFSLSIPVWAQPASPAPVQQKKHDKARHPQKGIGGPLMGWLGKELNLSDAQKAEFKALMADMKGQRPAREAHQKMMQTLKQAFLSETFDAATVRSQWQALHGKGQPHSQKMAQALVKGWKILTPEQREQVQARMAKMEERMQKYAAKPHAARPDKRMGKMFGDLNLTEAQQQQLTALMMATAPDQAKIQQARQLKQSVLTELKGGADPAKIAALLARMQPEMQPGIVKHLDMMAKAHAILTPAQRQQVVTQLEQRMKQYRGGMRPAKAEQG
jgi:Spy/CpxP family protein refolding chaperone